MAPRAPALQPRPQRRPFAGAAAGLTAGLGAELGLGAATAGALSGAAGNAASQYLTTGHINPAQLLTSAALGAATFRLATTIWRSPAPLRT